jgi:hypothetical protein
VTDDEVNPFDGACSTAAIFAAVYQECGAEGLRSLLDHMLAGHGEDLDGPIIPSREMLERDVVELTAMELPDVASIVMEAAERATPAHILYCPYDPQDRCNYTSWHRERSTATPESRHSSSPRIQRRPRSAFARGSA